MSKENKDFHWKYLLPARNKNSGIHSCKYIFIYINGRIVTKRWGYYKVVSTQIYIFNGQFSNLSHFHFLIWILSNYICFFWYYIHIKTQVNRNFSTSTFLFIWDHAVCYYSTPATIKKNKKKQKKTLNNNNSCNNNFNKHFYIMILFKQFYWLSCCHLTFRKIWYCLIKTRIDSLSLS